MCQLYLSKVVIKTEVHNEIQPSEKAKANKVYCIYKTYKQIKKQHFMLGFKQEQDTYGIILKMSRIQSKLTEHRKTQKSLTQDNILK